MRYQERYWIKSRRSKLRLFYNGPCMELRIPGCMFSILAWAWKLVGCLDKYLISGIMILIPLGV